MKFTAKYFWEQYKESGKRHLLITGWRGKGKTTLFNKLIKIMHPDGEILPGLYSVYIPGEGVMLRDNTTKAEAAVGIYCPEKAEIGKNMVPYADGFFTIGIPALEAAADSSSEWFTMDEIGFLESNEMRFQQALLKTMESKKLIAVVRKVEKGTVSFIDKILSRNDAFVIDLDDYENGEYWD